ncbi:MAG: ATP-binding protein, partial [Nitrospina sp.]|nr:ATP-binding protein [Nitrospina sp.]
LKNGKETKAVPAELLKTKVYLPDGNCVTLQEIVKNKKFYDGKTITKEKNTASRKDNYKIVVKDENVYLLGKEGNLHLNPKFGFGSMDLTKNPSALKKALSKVSHPMKSKVVAMNELSVVYGPTGSAKTLVMLSDTILDKTNRGKEDVVYVNLDDSAIGLAEKAEILAELNIKMIKEFDLMMLYSMINENVAKDKVIIIDTVKKIVNLMDKAQVADLMKHLKNFTHAGGTVILIAHANKNLGPDGLPVLEGVGDLKNDADCVVRVQRHKDIITMSNEKNRSYVELEAIFQTSETKDYKSLMYSVKQLSGQEAIDLKLQREQECFKEDNCRLIETITEMIGLFPSQKTKLVKDLIEDTGLSRKAIVDILELLEDDLWDLEKGPNNSKNYSLRTNVNPEKFEGDEEDVKEYLIREGYIPCYEESFPEAAC